VPACMTDVEKADVPLTFSFCMCASVCV